MALRGKGKSPEWGREPGQQGKALPCSRDSTLCYLATGETSGKEYTSKFYFVLFCFVFPVDRKDSISHAFF